MILYGYVCCRLCSVVKLYEGINISEAEFLVPNLEKLFGKHHNVMQLDGNSVKIETFRETTTSELMILFLKTSTRPYLCLAKGFFCLELV